MDFQLCIFNKERSKFHRLSSFAPQSHPSSLVKQGTFRSIFRISEASLELSMTYLSNILFQSKEYALYRHLSSHLFQNRRLLCKHRSSISLLLHLPSSLFLRLMNHHHLFLNLIYRKPTIELVRHLSCPFPQICL